MDTRAAIHSTIGLEHCLHLFCQLGIFSAVLAGRALTPGIVPTHRYRQHTAHDRHRILVPMLRNELVFHCLSREKMPMAFFTMSRSCFTVSNSRFSRRTSSSWAV